MEVSIVFISLFIVVFGIFYLYYTTRHKERLALIESDKDVSMFYTEKPNRRPGQPSHIGKFVILNLALISIGVGVGILFGNALVAVLGMQEEVAITASIFLTAGIGLLVGYYMTKKEEKIAE
jgi:hypothetical protein